MLLISIDDIPDFLRSSSLCADYCSQYTHNKVEVPEEFFTYNDNVESFSDFCKILRVINHWGVEHLPMSVITFCDTKNYATWCTIAEMTLRNQPQLFADLVTIFAKPSSLTTKIIRCMQIGRVDLLEYFADRDYFSDSLSATTFACSLGRIDYLMLLHKYGFAWSTITCTTAAKHSSLDCLIYARENGCRWTTSVVSEAAEHGAYECMQYALENGCPVSHRSCTYAAGGGHLDCLRLLYCHGAPWNADTAIAAAAGGHLNCLSFLYDRDCPWNEKVVTVAAQNGHKDCLVFAIERGCVVPSNACVLAAGAGHLHCWRVLHDYRCRITIS